MRDGDSPYIGHVRDVWRLLVASRTYGRRALERLPVTTWDEDVWTEVVGNHYLGSPDKSHLPYTQRAWATFAWEVRIQYMMLTDRGIRVQPGPDPVNPETGKPDMEYLRREFRETGVLRVYDGHLEHPILSEQEQVMFRAVHDMLGHFDTRAPFHYRGEQVAYLHHWETFSDVARVALACETMGQLTAGRVAGDFPRQKCVLLPMEYRTVPVATFDAY